MLRIHYSTAVSSLILLNLSTIAGTSVFVSSLSPFSIIRIIYKFLSFSKLYIWSYRSLRLKSDDQSQEYLLFAISSTRFTIYWLYYCLQCGLGLLWCIVFFIMLAIELYTLQFVLLVAYQGFGSHIVIGWLFNENTIELNQNFNFPTDLKPDTPPSHINVFMLQQKQKYCW